jgi:hypothetical protein
MSFCATANPTQMNLDNAFAEYDHLQSIAVGLHKEYRCLDEQWTNAMQAWLRTPRLDSAAYQSRKQAYYQIDEQRSAARDAWYDAAKQASDAFYLADEATPLSLLLTA